MNRTLFFEENIRFGLMGKDKESQKAEGFKAETFYRFGALF